MTCMYACKRSENQCDYTRGKMHKKTRLVHCIGEQIFSPLLASRQQQQPLPHYSLLFHLPPSCGWEMSCSLWVRVVVVAVVVLLLT